MNSGEQVTPSPREWQQSAALRAIALQNLWLVDRTARLGLVVDSLNHHDGLIDIALPHRPPLELRILREAVKLAKSARSSFDPCHVEILRSMPPPM